MLKAESVGCTIVHQAQQLELLWLRALAAATTAISLCTMICRNLGLTSGRIFCIEAVRYPQTGSYGKRCTYEVSAQCLGHLPDALE